MPRKPRNDYVFINCPFDAEFQPLFRSILFTLIYLEFVPIFATTKSSHEIRVLEIMKLIKKARFGIHDLSRNTSYEAGTPSRFNMPFELGLDIGCRHFGGRKYQHKKILILDSEPHLYDRYIGDISGQDIETHQNNPETLVQKIRDWMARIHKTRKFPGPNKIWNAYNQFKDDLPIILSDNFTAEEIRNLQMTDFIGYAQDWIYELKNSI